MLCDLCNKVKLCLPREIEGKQYAICAKCWNTLSRKLLGKGRVAKQKEREIVFLPPVTITPEPIELKPTPGQPPKIWSYSCRLKTCLE